MRSLPLLPLCVVMLQTACGPTCPPGGEGDLEIRVTGLPAGAAADLTLVGPEVNQAVNGPGILEGLSAGSHGVLGLPVAHLLGRVRSAWRPQATPNPVCVRQGELSLLEVEYTNLPGSGKLWVGTAGGEASIAAYGAEALDGSGAIAPEIRLGTAPPIAAPGALTFDRHGNLWVIDVRTQDDSILRVPARALGATGGRSADVVLRAEAFTAIPGPRALAFDSGGNLWVSVAGRDRVVRLAVDQISQSGSPVPFAEAGGPGSTMVGPTGLAFDAGGNLWVASTGSSRVMRYDVARLGVPTALLPDLSLEIRDPSAQTLTFPVGLAFDAHGNLWVSFSSGLVRLTPEDQAQSGPLAITPEVQLSPDLAGLPSGLAFDEEGGLWVAYRQGELARFSAEQLLASGSPAPSSVLVDAGLGAADWPALFPAPAGLPLFHSIP